MTISVASLVGDGSPTTKQVCDFFQSQGLRIKLTEYDNIEIVGRRGAVRNDQLKLADSDWVLFTDSDLAYDPLFFHNLASQLSSDLANEKLCISASRLSLDIEFCVKYFKELEGSKFSYPCLIPDVAKIVSNWPVNKAMAKKSGVGRDGRTVSIGAGYFQLANVAHLRDKFGGIYLDPNAKQDPLFGYHSDRRFRTRLGGIRSIQTLNQYHLNHERGIPLPYQR